MNIVDAIYQHYDISQIAELTIECNPDMTENVIQTIHSFQEQYQNLARLRFSIWVQTLDDSILQEAGRWYTSQTLPSFIDAIKLIKWPHTLYNMDLIAFGKLYDGKIWSEKTRWYFEHLLQTHLFDHCSIYTLELFEWSQRYHQVIRGNNPEILRSKTGYGLKKYGSDDDVYTEFDYLKTIAQQYGYHRYELSNFALSWHRSLHNQVYRAYGDYLGCGISSASKIGSQRRSNTKSISQYIHGHYQDPETVQHLTLIDQLVEEFFLWLRTNEWITNLLKYKSILESHYHTLLQEYHDMGMVKYDGKRLSLTDRGMDVYNYIVTELLL